MNNKIKLIFSIVLIFTFIAIGVSSYLIVELLKEDGEYVVISVDGEITARYLLTENGEYSLNGGTNILVIENGEAYMTGADCPDRLCIHQGRISRTGERIVCLPNRVMAEVVGEEDEIFVN